MFFTFPPNLQSLHQNYISIMFLETSYNANKVMNYDMSSMPLYIANARDWRRQKHTLKCRPWPSNSLLINFSLFHEIMVSFKTLQSSNTGYSVSTSLQHFRSELVSLLLHSFCLKRQSASLFYFINPMVAPGAGKRMSELDNQRDLDSPSKLSTPPAPNNQLENRAKAPFT